MTTKKQPKPRRLTVEQMAEQYVDRIAATLPTWSHSRSAYLAGYRAAQRRNRRAKR